MDILTTDISSLSFKFVKEKVDEININEAYNSKELIEIINILKSDKRKNINGLGDKLQKAKEKIENEIKRVRNMYNFDKSFENYNIIAGVDEVGRGPLAGPMAFSGGLVPLQPRGAMRHIYCPRGCDDVSVLVWSVSSLS